MWVISNCKYFQNNYILLCIIFISEYIYIKNEMWHIHYHLTRHFNQTILTCLSTSVSKILQPREAGFLSLFNLKKYRFPPVWLTGQSISCIQLWICLSSDIIWEVHYYKNSVCSYIHVYICLPTDCWEVITSSAHGHMLWSMKTNPPLFSISTQCIEGHQSTLHMVATQHPWQLHQGFLVPTPTNHCLC